MEATKTDMGAGRGRAEASRLGHVIEQFDSYYRWMDAQHSGRFNDLGVEARKRLVQLRRLLDKIIDLMAEAHDCQSRTMPPWEGQEESLEDRLAAWQERMKTDEMCDLLKRYSVCENDMEMLTESFYWIAARARTAIRALPDLQRFECEGIRNVRNKLLEHSEKADSRVLITSFGWGAECGPVLKAVRTASQSGVWPDPGLFVNVREFSDNLEAILSRVSTAQ